ncbi:MAG TPA: LamG domain-containing protein, partial [Polyangia bacterium]
VCTNGVCTTRPAGLVLYWAFDESAGSSALDSSGNGLHGVYGGESGSPSPSPNVPTLMFANPRSRSFAPDNRHYVQLANMSAALKPSNNFTISVWFRTTGTVGATEIVTGGGAYALRIRSTQVEFFKSTGGGGGIYCRGTVSNHLNGAWHHLAGVQTPSGMKVYFDGIERGADNDGSNPVYDQRPDFQVARHIEFVSWDFVGNADEVRVYQRALSASEIAALAQGRN